MLEGPEVPEEPEPKVLEELEVPDSVLASPVVLLSADSGVSIVGPQPTRRMRTKYPCRFSISVTETHGPRSAQAIPLENQDQENHVRARRGTDRLK